MLAGNLWVAILFALSFLSGLQSMTVPDVGNADDLDTIRPMEYTTT